MHSERLSPIVINYLVLSWLVLMSSIQAVLILFLVLSYFPPISGLQGVVLPEWQPTLRPEHEVVLYRTFVVTALVMQTAGVFILRGRLDQKGFAGSVKSFAIVETLLTFFCLSALFKMTVYSVYPELARAAFKILIVSTVVNKIFWVKLKEVGAALYTLITNEHNALALSKLADIAFPFFILLLIYIPDPEAVVARIFIGEQFHHWDSAIVAPCWAYISGCLLDVDVISRYGLGMPIVFSHLAKIFGGFTHNNALLVMMWATIVYYILWYTLLRMWLKSVLIAMIAILFAIKAQMFHTGAYPLVFTYPSATIIRFWFDIVYLFLIYAHLQTRKNRFLIGAGIVAGAAVFNMTDTGIYLAASYYAYILVQLLIPHVRPVVCAKKRDVFKIIGYGAVLPVSALFFIWLTQGHHIWTSAFWHNFIGFIEYFVGGFGVTPIYETMQKLQLYLASFMGLVVPLVYVVSMLLIVTLVALKKMDVRNLFAFVLCIYGLALYNYYVGRSAETSYYVGGHPYVFIVCYWFHYLVQFATPARCRNVLLVALGVCLWALFTNHMFISYPNLLNFSRNPMVDLRVWQPPPGRISYFHHLFREYPDAFKMPFNSLGETDEQLKTEKDFASDADLVAYYRKEFSFDKDVELIKKLTTPETRVPLLTSFEVRMLMRADRKPFFYFTAMCNSRPMRMRIYPVGNIYTFDHLEKTMNELKERKPEYIFMERMFLSRQVPQAYYYDSYEIMVILDYVNEHYTPTEYGEYLVAMKRKGTNVR